MASGGREPPEAVRLACGDTRGAHAPRSPIQSPPCTPPPVPNPNMTRTPVTASNQRPAGAPAPAGFEFYPVTRVVFGPGSLARLGELTREMGGRRVLVVTDPGLKAAGHPHRALESLRAANLETFLFD